MHAGFRFRSVGDSDNLADALGDLVAAYYIESTRWPDFRAEQICENAWTLDAIRIDLVRGAITREDADVWFDAGMHHLGDIRRERIRDVEQ